MPVSFEVYPRRIVRLPSGERALVLIRRNVDGKYNQLDPVGTWSWLWGQVARLLWRGRTWRVEIYEGISEDPISTPNENAVSLFVCEDKSDAVATANRVVARIARSGIPAIGEYV